MDTSETGYFSKHGTLSWGMDDGGLEIRRTDDAIIWQFNRPQARNALSLQTMAQLEDAVRSCRTEAPHRPVVLRGSGGWFASGGDLKEFSLLSGTEARHMAARMQSILRSIEDLPMPTVAALNGPAIGGGAEVSLAFDLRVASEAAYLRFPQAQLGLSTGWQGGERLLAVVGYARALEILLVGREVNAAEAGAIGIFNHVWAPASFEGELAMFLARLSQSGEAGRAIKRLLRASRAERSTGTEELSVFERLWDVPDRGQTMRRALKRQD